MRLTTEARRIAWAGVLAAAVLLLVVAAVGDRGPRTAAERAQSLNEVYACPECDGQSVAESNAAVAATIRQFIREQVAVGATDTEIRDRLVAAYGSEVLLTPPSEGISSLIWILPVVVLVGGAAAVAVSVQRSRLAARPVTADDERVVADALRQRSS